MPASTAEDAARRERLAQTLLDEDGLRHGPGVSTATGAELRAGDRVRVDADIDDLHVGTLGTVEDIDVEAGEIEIDFATWGRLRTTIGVGIAEHLGLDYTELLPPDPAVEIDGPELDDGLGW